VGSGVPVYQTKRQIFMAGSINEMGPLYSSMSNDPDFGELVEMFVEEIPDRIEKITTALNTEDRELLQRTAHQLKGAMGSYGFDAATPYAARLEGAVCDGLVGEELETVVGELIDLCNLVRSGSPQ
jgi:HPt (histidine-containing phosphotransfer) domain-containing protein